MKLKEEKLDWKSHQQVKIQEQYQMLNMYFMMRRQLLPQSNREKGDRETGVRTHRVTGDRETGRQGANASIQRSTVRIL